MKDPDFKALSAEATSGQAVALTDILLVVAAGKRQILIAILATTLLFLTISFVQPKEYQAQTSILPPKQNTTAAALLAGQVSGALGGAVSSAAGLSNPSDEWIDILKSRSVAQGLIEEFGLGRVYRQQRLSSIEQALERHSNLMAAKDGLITIGVRDTDPNRAAAIANGYVEQLYKQNRRLALTEASQRRLFFEQELRREKDALADAEVDLKRTQLATGIIEIQGQTENAIRAIASVRAEIASRQVELQGMLSSETPDNPDVVRLRTELAALRVELERLESSDSDKVGGGNISLPASKVPEANLDYIRKVREVKYHETLFELLARQLEAAKLDEAKDAPLFQVVDPAIVPDRPSSLARSIVAIIGMVSGFALGSLWVLFSEVRRRVLMDEEEAMRWASIRDHLLSRRAQ